MSGDLFNLYWMLVTSGLVLIAAEIFVPGGILGVIGTIALLVAGLLGFTVFGPLGGLLSAIGLLIGGAIFISLWIRYCPHSMIGRWFTLKEDGSTFKSSDNTQDHLLGQTGTAHTDLRPAGMAMIGGHKIDVLSEAGYITSGTAIKVIAVTGNRVVVREADPA